LQADTIADSVADALPDAVSHVEVRSAFVMSMLGEIC
jgi:hypothetical protein